jgi:hypothetical protein
MFVVGYATDAEIAELTERGWDVEPAERHGLIGAEGTATLMTAPTIPGTSAVAIFVDASVSAMLKETDVKPPDARSAVFVRQPGAVRPKQEEAEPLPLLRLDVYALTKLRLESELRSLVRRCAHQFADGTTMIAPSPYGQGETYCPNCGNKWD